MMRNNFFLKLFALAALVGLSASPSQAEWLQQRVARGNNVGLGLMTDWCTPMITASWTGNTIQFPKGSGNLILNDAWTIGMMTANDLNLDGVPEDTAVLGSGGRDNMAFRCSVEARDMLTQLSQGGLNMETAAGARAGTGIDRVWTSLDAGELADWPVEAREPKTASGTPVLHGAETMFLHTGDVFNSWGAPLSGFYMGWSFYFLDFGESNNMVYVHQYMANVTEYMKWNPAYGAPGFGNGLWTDGSAPPPDGWTWHGMILFNNWRQMGFGRSSNLGWAYHPAKDINSLWCRDPLVSNWTPQEPPILGLKVLKYPRLGEQETKLINIHTVSGTEFGFSGAGNLLAMGLSYQKVYRAVMNQANLYTGQTNPFTEELVTDGWPGILEPRHKRYNQWIWGGGDNWNHYLFWGEMKGVAPRDTFSMDWVMMFSPTGVTPLVAPTYDIANIDDPMMQTAFAPQEHYASVAVNVFEGAFITPETPQAPALTIIPGDREVTITWSDINLQTPDKYYYFVEEKGLNPDGYYQEYDFEGYRLYRSYVGPNDSHSEMIYTCSLSAGDLTFFYIDKMEDDQPYFRMRNGMKVWYALVPYDQNYDTVTGEMFSLPALTAGKGWNRAGEAGLYNVIPRSDASNFIPASYGGVTFLGTTEAAGGTAALAGDGAGKLTEAPKLLEPPFDFSFEAINNERITKDLTVYIACTGLEVDWGCSYWARPERVISLLDGSNNVISTASPFLTRDATAEIILMDKADAAGVNYAIHALWDHPGSAGNRDYAPVYIDFNTGGYTGATVANQFGSCVSSRVGTGPSIGSYIQTGVFELTWKSAGGGLSVDVTDKTRGESVPFSPYREDKAWGFMPGGTYMDFFDEVKAGTSKSERTNLMLETIPADNTDEFAISINGIVWAFTDITAMPSSGTVMTITNAFGAWNGDQTVFTQYADAPYPGDKWEIKINAMSLDPENADLSKVKVVPNPYMASSFLDLSITQRRIEFINLPDRCTIRIYTLGGNLVNVINHIGANRSGWGNYTDWDRLTQGVPKGYTGYDNHSGTEPWNLRNRFGQTVASGLYFFHVTDSRGEMYTGKFYIIN